MKITFLLHNAYAVGGTVRSTLNLAGALAARHDVEIVSVLRTEERPLLGKSGKVRLVPLVDERPDAASYDGGHELMSRPSAVVPPTEVLAHRYTALTDERLRAFLDTTDADVVVATRPALVVALAGHGSVGSRRPPGASRASGTARRGPLLIGQEHLSYDNHVPGVREAQNAAIGRLDAFVTVSARDAADHRRHLPGLRTRITDIANAAPRPKAEPSDLRAPLVVAAGRLFPVKRYDLLVEAFAKVVAERPEWRLRIYGKGPERANLRAAIDTLGLNDHVFLMGPSATLETEWPKASVAAVSSEWESFGMTILEAMHAGVPVVATDCPHGPGEIVTDGTDGLLVTPNDPNALATGLLRLIDDPELRQRVGTAGRTTVQRYAPRVIAAEYERLIADLQEARTPATVKLGRRLRRALRRNPSTTDGKPGALAPRAGAAEGRAAETAAAGPGAAKPSAASAVPKPLRPKAGCRVGGRGEVRVSVAASGVSGTDLTLVLRGRHAGDEVRLPLRQDTPGDARSPWTATLDRDGTSLAEGRWDLHVERGEDGARRRLRAGPVEQRGLLTAEPPDRSPVAWWIPYPTKDGYLALRTFHRTAHAEVTALPVGDGSIAVEGVLHGDVLGEGATLVGVARGEDVPDFEAPATRAVGRRASGRPAFHARLTSLPDPVGPDKVIWDLFLRPATDAEPIRLGRLFDDIVDRKDTDKYPAVTMATPGGASPQARFFFTVTNDLAVALS
ncbi:glycosyltransferase family 4 protein [Streptomyces caniscabiei]|uniref:D-inositol 3-phosphate glycosyltransferase n=1 Tax=Streptomyces caniscabiei TaxID=2746961 RepID=A0A927L5U3_9ACTN|nr:glycosyltransferase family 4 protein [Streptomyces caniscabiei]MBD9723113.1 glycosyltransferase family 4 protein [Streptomyces caniscabiei]MDX3508262.1 glycosyltransferase family 4 protein [Streptomyces caniscabiei]MDX3719431.1 glycosyltransferase family 4 protein [Streptomyces caniscabiei]WEO24752.1 glycosyltransferase family 4 protein [Streptomyces caniscabiei]